MAYRSKGLNPFDDDDDTGFGSKKSSNLSSRGQPHSVSSGQRSRGMEHGLSGGYSPKGSNPARRDEEQSDYRIQEQIAIRRMEESSANALRTLNETCRMGVDTAIELENQAETLDRVETRLDEMHVDLDKSKQNMRRIKSPFGGLSSLLSKKKTIDEVVNPKGFKPPTKPSSTSSSKKSAKSAPPELQHCESTGSKIVDDNLDEMSRQLNRLMGLGEHISDQLDDSDVQIERVKYKMERNEVKIQGVTKDIKTQL